MENVFDTLKERGFIQQVTHEDEVRKLLGGERVTFYIGFDPTADSLHIGNFVQFMAMTHLLRAGHRPIALIGGGTTMVPDPTGKTDMRRILSAEEINKHGERFKAQMAKYLDFGSGRVIAVNNADWLLELNYINVLREIGPHFTVNRMLAAECYKSRYERGLSFIEFNYMILQSYDFLELFRRYGCKMQFGGNDQWSNIIGGVELIRRVENAEAYGMTFSLLTTGDGVKMGKTQSGAIWLNPEKTPPYDFFQYFRNVEDAKVGECLGILTFIPMDEVRRLAALPGSEINRAKEILAYETTKIVHGEAEADKALAASRALFGGSGPEAGADAPAVEISRERLAAGINIIDALELSGLISTRSEGRRLVDQGGVSVNGAKVSSLDHVIKPGDFAEGKVLLQKGKKAFRRLVLV